MKKISILPLNNENILKSNITKLIFLDKFFMADANEILKVFSLICLHCKSKNIYLKSLFRLLQESWEEVKLKIFVDKNGDDLGKAGKFLTIIIFPLHSNTIPRRDWNEFVLLFARNRRRGEMFVARLMITNTLAENYADIST